HRATPPGVGGATRYRWSGAGLAVRGLFADLALQTLDVLLDADVAAVAERDFKAGDRGNGLARRAPGVTQGLVELGADLVVHVGLPGQPRCRLQAVDQCGRIGLGLVVGQQLERFLCGLLDDDGRRVTLI